MQISTSRRRWWICLFAFTFSLLSFTARGDESVDWTIRAAYASGALLGVPITEDELSIVKTLVSCGLGEQSLEKTMRRCAIQHIAGYMPPEARDLTTCLLTHADVRACSAAEMINRVPERARPLAQCMIDNHSAVGTCAQRAIDANQKKALSVIDKLKADARSKLDVPSDIGQPVETGRIRNLIDIAKGIKNDDWVMVFVAGGAVVYKAATKIILVVFFPPLQATGPILDNVVDAIIQRRADEFKTLIIGIRRRDARVLSQLVAEVYLFEGTNETCDVVNSLLPDEIHDGVCGPLRQLMQGVSGIAGDGGAAVAKAIRGPLGQVLSIFGPPRPQCVAPDQYFANRYALCVAKGVYLASEARQWYQEYTGALVNECVGYYSRCGIGNAREVCTGIRDVFVGRVDALRRSLLTGAEIYRSRYIRKALNGPRLACSAYSATAAHQDFIGKCQSALAAKFVHLPNGPAGGYCYDDPAKTVFLATCQTLSNTNEVPHICAREEGLPVGCTSYQCGPIRRMQCNGSECEGTCPSGTFNCSGTCQSSPCVHLIPK